MDFVALGANPLEDFFAFGGVAMVAANQRAHAGDDKLALGVARVPDAAPACMDLVDEFLVAEGEQLADLGQIEIVGWQPPGSDRSEQLLAPSDALRQQL